MRHKSSLFVLSFFLALVGCVECFGQADLIFPVIFDTSTDQCKKDCTYWMTFPSVFNPNGTEGTVTFTYYDSNGNITAASGTLAAPPFEGLNAAGLPFRNGWAKISGSQVIMGREKIQFVTRSADGTTDVRSQIFLSPAPLSRTHIVKPESMGVIGLAVVFPSAPGGPPAKGQLIHRDDGRIISVKDVVIEPNGQLIGYLSELLPPESFANSQSRTLFGTVEIVFDQDVAVTALQFAESDPIKEVIVESDRSAGPARR